MRRLLAVLGLLPMAACLDNAGPEDFPAQQIRIVAAPEGTQFPTDTLDETIAIQVTDERGNPSPGRQVAWSTSGGGTVHPTSHVTDAGGIVRALWILGPEPGTQTATATVASTDISVAIPVTTEGWRVAVVSSAQGGDACAIDLAGDTYCWGRSYGPTPTRIPTPVRLTSIATGSGYACGLGEDRRVYCWGYNGSGQLGDGSTADRAVPASPLLPDIGFRSVVTGGSESCAVAMNGTAYCWGLNRLGILGRGFESEFETVPAPVAGGQAWRTISISDFAACGTNIDRRVFCWGEGDNEGPTVLAPLLVEGLSADTVALSDYAKCALSGATLYCWGSSSGIDTPRLLSPRMRSMSAGYKPFFGLGADGFGYYWGGLPNSTYGWGDPPARFEGDLRLRSVGGNDGSPYAIELETSTLYTWPQFYHGLVSRPIAPTPIRPPLE